MAAEYGLFERRVARMLSRFPMLKYWIKQGYARTVYALAGGESSSVAQAPVHEVGSEDTHTFFGYYDKSPVSADGWLLCHASHHASDQPPRMGQSVNVEVYGFGSHPLQQPVMSLRTHAFNWQQGARAHWLDGDCFIFNDFDVKTRRHVSRVASVASRAEVARHALPVQDSWRQEYFLSLNYRRLQALRPDYGYCNLPALDAQTLARLDDDGIWRVELGSGANRLLYSLEQVCMTEPEPDFAEATHKVNHVMIAPGGQQFIFLHRRFIGRRKSDRLLLGASDGTGLRVLSAQGMVSHCFWIDDDSLLCYLRGPSGHDGYHTVDCRSGEVQPLFDGQLDSLGDGHPHVHGDWFVTDTYPDKRRMQHLLRGNLRTGQVQRLGQFHHSFRYGGEARCDLHPRVTPDGRWVFFDSVSSGRRRLCFLDLHQRED